MIENNNGIYIHIPFCKKACHYCNFHFSVNTSMIDAMVDAIAKEVFLSKEYIKKPVQSIYFGGGTPSLLEPKHINYLLQEIYKYFDIEDNVEITFEVNPDDLSSTQPVQNYRGSEGIFSETKLQTLKDVGVNRLSIGIQSFDDANLKYINRAHNSHQAVKAFVEARKLGFDNISIDLIYGIPNSTLVTWQKDINMAISLKPEHISSYCLTIEKNTYFGKLHSNKKLPVKSSNEEIAMYDVLVNSLTKAGYIQYEISNFCFPNKYSRHNTNYWKKGNYLGLGPSAHSYNQKSRQWNIRSNKKYIDAIARLYKDIRQIVLYDTVLQDFEKSFIYNEYSSKDLLPYELEVLSDKDHINEYIMTGLRTIWGLDTHYIKNKYNYNILEYCKKDIQDFVSKGYLTLETNILKSTSEGFKLTDEVSSRLFVV